MDRRIVGFLLISVLGCSGDKSEPLGPFIPGPTDQIVLPRLAICDVNVSIPSVTCSIEDGTHPNFIQLSKITPQASANGLAFSVAGAVRATNVSIDESRTTVSFDLGVTNTMRTAVGTTNGVSSDGSLALVLPKLPQAISGYGNVALVNPTGVTNFAGSDLPFMRYDEMLLIGQASASHTWKFSFETSVASFRVPVLIVGSVPRPDGWIDIIPPEAAVFYPNTYQVNWQVKDAGGFPTTRQVVSWLASDTSVATITSSGLVRTLKPGTVQLTAIQLPLTSTSSLQVKSQPNS